MKKAELSMASAARRPLLSPWGAVATTLKKQPAFPLPLAELLRSGDLDETGAFLACQLARLAQLDEPERDRVAELVGRLLAAQAGGSTRIAVDAEAVALLARAVPLVRRDLAPGVPRSPLVLEGGYLYTERAHAAECRIARQLAARLGQHGFSPALLRSAVDDAARSAAPRPSDEQKRAVIAGLTNRLGLISGGPGTGKTTTALLLVRALVRLGLPASAIALAAPTGKAKSRLEGDFRSRLGGLPDAAPIDRDLLVLCPEAQTLHHLLGARSGRRGFRRSAADPLPYRAVVVDESSMIDLVLMDRLLDALPADSLLVLLGDADQLPSVATGAVFRDLGELATRLSQGFRADPARRAGAELVALAKAVRDGQGDEAAALCAVRATPAELAHHGAERIEPRHRGDLLRAQHAQLADAGALRHVREHTLALDGNRFDDEASARLETAFGELMHAGVLAVTRQGPAGVTMGNAFLHDLEGGGAGFLPGEPVLVLRNDYQRELWNGDQGIAVRARRPGGHAETVCAFRSRRGWIAVDQGGSGTSLDLGYVLTVHKAQGSEYDEVLLLLPDHACALLTRELVYTALSRARTSVIVCGTAEHLAAAIATRELRSSGIAERMTRLQPGILTSPPLFANHMPP